MKETARILGMAADLVARPNGWIQGARWRPGEGGGIRYCAIGAIEQATRQLGGDSMAQFKAGAALAEYLGIESIVPNLKVAEWNDMIRRTQTEVVEALRKAAAYVEYGNKH